MKGRYGKSLILGLAAFAVTLAASNAGSAQGIIHYFGGGGTTVSGTRLVVLHQEMPPFPLTSNLRIGIASTTAKGIINVGPVKLNCAVLEPYSPEISGGTRVAPGATLYASGKVIGAANRYVLIKARDVGVVTSSLGARDSAAVRFVNAPGGGSRCGAESLVLKPLASGGFVSARCDQGVVCM